MPERGSGEFAERRDAVLVLARGQSRRMGRPKGLLRLTETGPSLARLVLQLYTNRGWPVVLVTLPELAAAYRRDLPPDRVTLVTETPGGGTAPTVRAGYRHLIAACPGLTHVWAHPVDLPLVKAATVAQLLAASVAAPVDVVRAAHDSQPGHPVVLPTDLLGRLASTDRAATADLRSWLSEIERAGGMAPVRLVTVPDVGVIRDLDTPQAWRAAVHERGSATRRTEDDD